MSAPEFVTPSQAQAFLEKHYSGQATAPQLLGEGAWSRCYGFQQQDQDLVIRFGRYLDDFQNDQRAYQYQQAALPIPKVLEIGEAFDGFYAISSRVFGVALESLDAPSWQEVIPSLVEALEAMRLADLGASQGYGGWDRSGNAPEYSWAEHLLKVDQDHEKLRNQGWKKKLASSRMGQQSFAWGLDILKDVAQAPTPRCLIHADLINRNAYVLAGKLSGVFDWGCSRYGDHLYDLAWFEFWSPWYPKLDVGLLRTALEARWQEANYRPAFLSERLKACALHIGLDHLAYNAYLEDWPTLEATAQRMHDVVGY